MKTLSLSKKFHASKEQSWELLSNIEAYPQFVPFIRNVTLSGPLEEGMIWFDTTTLLWISQRVSHKMEIVKEYEQLVFSVPIIGGVVTEAYQISSEGDKTIITMNISVHMKHWVLEETFGRILLSRFHNMLTKTLENLDKQLLKSNQKKKNKPSKKN